MNCVAQYFGNGLVLAASFDDQLEGEAIFGLPERSQWKKDH